MQLVLLTSFQRFKKPTHTTHCAAALRFDLASYWCWVSWFPLPWELIFKTTAQISVSSSTFLSSLSFPSLQAFLDVWFHSFSLEVADFVSLLPIFTCIMVFQWGFFGGDGGCFLFLFCFEVFFAILNHVAFKAVTGLTLKEDTGRISFRPGHQFTYPTVLVSRGQTKWPQKYHWKEKKKCDCRILRVWPVVTVILRISLRLSKRMHAASLLLDVAWEWHGETPSPCWALLCSHGHVSSWSSVQSVSSPPFPLPLLYLYCQETSFHLGLLCFVRWVLHYIMYLFLCVLWGCLEHKAHCKLILEQKVVKKI